MKQGWRLLGGKPPPMFFEEDFTDYEQHHGPGQIGFLESVLGGWAAPVFSKSKFFRALGCLV
jgi:hypothetical protein